MLSFVAAAAVSSSPRELTTDAERTESPNSIKYGWAQWCVDLRDYLLCAAEVGLKQRQLLSKENRPGVSGLSDKIQSDPPAYFMHCM